MSKTIIAMILFIIIAIAGLAICEKRKKKKIGTEIIVFGLIAGLIAINFTGKVVAIPTEKIEIEVSDMANDADEIFLKEILIDNKIVEIPEPTEGKWVWRGDTYGWLNTEDTVLEDVTSSIKIKIPKGYTRKLVFDVGDAQGKINVVSNGMGTIYELNGESGELVAKLAPNSSKELYGFRLMQLLVFVGVFTLLYFCLCAAYRKLKAKDANINEKYKYHVVYLGIAYVSFLYLFSHADFASFWSDEMYTVGFAMSDDFPNSLFITSDLLRKMYRIMPYGQQYLLLLPILCYVISVYFLGLIGKRLCGGKAGIFAATCLAFSAYAFNQVAYEYRTYYMYVLCSVVALYLLIVRLQGKQNILTIVMYGITLLMLMDSQEYGKVLVGMFVVLELFFITFKKLHVKNLLSELFVVGYGLFWLTHNTIGGLWNNYSWPLNPTPEIVYGTVLDLCSKSEFQLSFLVLGFSIIFGNFLYSKKKLEHVLNNYQWILIYMIIGVFTASIIYSNYVNPENSLYLTRYFVSVMCYMFVIIGIGLEHFINWVANNKKESAAMMCGWLALWIAFYGWQRHLSMPYITNVTYRHQDYRATAEWINKQKDVYDKDTLVYVAAEKYTTDGWNYYFTHNGKKDDATLSYNKVMTNITDYEKIYLVKFNYDMIGQNKAILDENYELVENVTKEDIGCPVYVYEKKKK